MIIPSQLNLLLPLLIPTFSTTHKAFIGNEPGPNFGTLYFGLIRSGAGKTTSSRNAPITDHSPQPGIQGIISGLDPLCTLTANTLGSVPV